MAVTITYDGAVPTPGADADVWGVELNDGALAKVKVDLDAIAAALNTILVALLKTGGTMTGDVVLADVGPGSIYSVGFRGLPVVGIDANRTFGLTDSGKMIRLTGTTARTWTIPPNSSVAFPIGTVIVLRTASTGTVAVARGASVALRSNGSSTDADKTIPAYTKAVLTQEAANVWTIDGVA